MSPSPRRYIFRVCLLFYVNENAQQGVRACVWVNAWFFMSRRSKVLRFEESREQKAQRKNVCAPLMFCADKIQMNGVFGHWFLVLRRTLCVFDLNVRLFEDLLISSKRRSHSRISNQISSLLTLFFTARHDSFAFHLKTTTKNLLFFISSNRFIVDFDCNLIRLLRQREEKQTSNFRPVDIGNRLLNNKNEKAMYLKI